MIVTPVAVADLNLLSKALNTELDGILGQDVLSQFSRVTIDYEKKQLILEKKRARSARRMEMILQFELFEFPQ